MGTVVAKDGTEIEIPAEHDVGIFTQGVRSKEGGAPDENPFHPEFPHQFSSWAAGYAAGTAPVDPDAPEPEAARKSKRSSSFE